MDGLRLSQEFSKKVTQATKFTFCIPKTEAMSGLGD
jgi:hypothetical protein